MRLAITIISFVAILLGLIILYVCWDFWNAYLTVSAGGAGVLLCGALLIGSGLLALAVLHSRKN